MKTVITTVGTSLFTNYFDKKKNNEADETERNYYDRLKNKQYSEWKDYEDRINRLKPVIVDWTRENSDASAEIKSLLKIQISQKSELDVKLLISDTILSRLAAEIIQKYFEGNDNIQIDKHLILIKDLQVENYNKFIKGRDNLVKEIRDIIGREFNKDGNTKKALKNIADNYIFNISGGYKIIIPTITIVSQLYEMKSFYIFENSDDLIEDALMPLGFDDFLLENLYFSIGMLKHQNDYKERDSSIKKILSSANFVIGNEVTALGELFYDYVYYHREVSENVLGYFVEYKLYEYFIVSKKYKDIKHSYTGNDIELDLVLDNKTIVEVKSIAMFMHKDGVTKIKKQIDGQIEHYPEYTEHHLVLYTSYKEVASKHKEINDNITELYLQLKDNHRNIEFKCFNLYWSLGGIVANQYQTFMKRPLTDKDITEISIKGGKDV